ncbi:Chitinase [Purpureocillium takamizusanense]|uniref:chitinase n=1 Tax=Purpureocillium takamizusanense TaxID=2060973 RepID=A0A9Q8V7R1_9HYPO|nr:Chitinase [Purpureocillium takamizusanense]UNI14736.1 Chitinase [Purpureocillium takamizusanense]
MGSSVSRYFDLALTVSGSPVNAVYYPSWKLYDGKPPSIVQAEVVTHVYYAFVGVHENGTLRSLDEYADFEAPIGDYEGCIDALGGLKKRNPSIKTLVSLGGAKASDEFPALAASEESRQELASSVREFCDRHGFDGVDGEYHCLLRYTHIHTHTAVDWEHPETPEQGRDFIKLLGALRSALPPEADYLVTAALPTTANVLDNVDLWEAARALDLLNLMAYDFTGDWTRLSGHQAQLWPPTGVEHRAGGVAAAAAAAATKKTKKRGEDGDDDADLRLSGAGGVEYASREGVPASKIVLGVPAYARYFPGAEGYGETFDASRSDEVDYCDVLNGSSSTSVVITSSPSSSSAASGARTRTREEGTETKGPGSTVVEIAVDAEAVAASFVDRRPGGRGFVSLDVPETVAMKAGYAKCMGLGGLFYWHGAGDRTGDESLTDEFPAG